MSKNSNIWALDSASEEHTTPHKELLTDLTKVDDHPGYITADGNVFVPKWKGQVEMILRDRDGKSVVLQLNDVHYLPGSPCNLMSEGILREKNHFYNPALMQLDFSNAFSAPLFMAGKVPVMVVVLQLNDVHYLPGSPCNLMSEGILREKNHFYNPALMQLDLQ